MKHAWSIGIAAVVWSLAAPVQSLEATALKAAQEHLALATAYQQKAAEQQQLIVEHAQMKKEYKQRFYINEKVSPLLKIQELEAHCGVIIKEAQALSAEFESFANGHRIQAAELEGG